MRVLRESDYITVPWKNGGGVTREILRMPADPTVFDWRLSLATIDSPGPFSSFDGYHRTLVLVRGAGVELNFGRHGRSTLDAPGQTASFDGAWPTSCTLLNGPSTDLNLIVSRERARSASHCLHLETAQLVDTADWERTLVCCISGRVRLANTTEVQDLTAADVAMCLPGDGPITCSRHGPEPACVFVAGLSVPGNRQAPRTAPAS